MQQNSFPHTRAYILSCLCCAFVTHTYHIVPDRMHSYRHTALSEISNRFVGKYCYALLDITHYFSSDVGFTNIVVKSMGQSGVQKKYGVPTVRGQ